MRKLAYPDSSNISPMVAVFQESAGYSEEYRIVAVKKGDCVRGYKIRHDQGTISKYRGAMVYTLESARELREFYRRTDNTAHTTFEVIE